MVIQYVISALCVILMISVVGINIWTILDNNRAWKEFLKESSIKISDLKIKEVVYKNKK